MWGLTGSEFPQIGFFFKTLSPSFFKIVVKYTQAPLPPRGAPTVPFRASLHPRRPPRTPAAQSVRCVRTFVSSSSGATV